MKAWRQLLTVIAGVAVLACERRNRLAGPDSAATIPPGESHERSTYLSVSDLAPRAGDTIVVAGTLGIGQSVSLGSYRVRLEYDSARLRYVDEIPQPGMLRVINAVGGAVIVAGASSESSTDGRFFALRFRVIDSTGLDSFLLKVDELNDANFASTTKTVTPSSRLILDRTLAQRNGAAR